jgi:hypothetical protein
VKPQHRLGPCLAIALATIACACGPGASQDITTGEGYQHEIDLAKAATALPPEATWPPYVDVTDRDAGYDRGGGRSQVEGVAFCLWLQYWVHSARSGDEAAKAAAAAVIVAAPSQEFITGKFADQSYRDVIVQVIADVRADNPAAVLKSGRPPCPELR